MSAVKSPEELSALKNGKEDKIVSEKAESEELPPGWTIEVKTRKGESGKKVDRYYTDPVTKYTFRSLKDVQRYLKTGQLGRLAIKPKDDNSSVDTDSGKRSGEPENKPEGHRKRTNSGEKNEPELPQRASKRPTPVKLEPPPPPPSPPERKTRSATKLAGIKTPPEHKTRQATKLAGILTDTPLLPERKTRQATKLAGILTDTPSPAVPKTRQAKRLAGIKTDSPPPSPPDPKTCQKTAARPEKEPETTTTIDKKPEEEKSNAVVDIIANLEPEIPIITPPVTQQDRKDDTNANENQEPPPAAAALASLTLTLTVDPPVNNPIDIKPESPVNFSLNDLWTDPCIEFAVKTLTGAIPFSDLNKSGDFPATSPPLEVPLEDLWTDPCIEFAVKTLTGAIPVTGDISVQDYLQNQPVCSLPDVGMNSFCQTEVLSKHFETGTHNSINSSSSNNNNKLPDSVVPAIRNGGLPEYLQNSGNGVKGGNNNINIGQCSRGRFYQ